MDQPGPSVVPTFPFFRRQGDLQAGDPIFKSTFVESTLCGQLVVQLHK